MPGVAEFIGFIGLAPVNFDAAFTPAMEVGWRIPPIRFGEKGLDRPGGARAALKYGFEQLGLEKEVDPFTAVEHNQRSRRVMGENWHVS